MKTLIYFNIALTITLLSSCVPMTKEKYLEQYEEFINEVSKDHEKYTEEDWEKAEEKLKKFNEEWYKKFEEEFTLKDEMKISKYTAMFNMYKTASDFNDILKIFSTDNDEYKEMETKIKHYIDNDMEKDLKEMIEQAKEISDTAFIIINKIIQEYQKTNNAQ